jgi:hypothetical protein
MDELGFKQLTRQTARGENLDEVLVKLASAVQNLGRARVRAALRHAIGALGLGFAHTPAFAALEDELARLEVSYG